MLSQTLKQLRLQHGKTQNDISSQFNITRQSYNHYETGKRTPDSEMLARLADYFNVSVDYLLGREDINRKPATSQDDGLTDLDRQLHNAMALMTEEQKQFLLSQIKALKALQDAEQSKDK